MVRLCEQRVQKLDSGQMQSTFSKPLQHQRKPLPSLSRQQAQVSLRLRHTERSHTIVIHRAIPTLEKQLPSLHLTEMHDQLHAQGLVSFNQPLHPSQQLVIRNATNFIEPVCHVQPPAAVRRIYITREFRSPAAPLQAAKPAGPISKTKTNRSKPHASCSGQQPHAISRAAYSRRVSPEISQAQSSCSLIYFVLCSYCIKRSPAVPGKCHDCSPKQADFSKNRQATTTIKHTLSQRGAALSAAADKPPNAETSPIRPAPRTRHCGPCAVTSARAQTSPGATTPPRAGPPIALFKPTASKRA
jgi:hypothetical protein